MLTKLNTDVMRSLRLYCNIPQQKEGFEIVYFTPTCWTNTEEFCLNAYNKSKWFMKYVGGTCLDDASLTKGAWIGIVECPDDLREVMEQQDWTFLQMFRTGQETIGKADIIYAYEKYKNQ